MHREVCKLFTDGNPVLPEIITASADAMIEWRSSSKSLIVVFRVDEITPKICAPVSVDTPA